MKWIALAFALVAILPFAALLRRSSHIRLKVWAFVGFLPFGIDTFHFYMAVVSWPGWPGYVKGAEVSLLDLVLVALYLGSPGNRDKLPFRWAGILYFIAILISALQTQVPIASLFYAWQLARIFFAYIVVARASADPAVVRAILTGMAFGLVFQAGASLWERIGGGVLQAGGLIGHQNTLGLMSHFVAFPTAALVLAGARGWRPLLGPAAAILAAVLTVSRATIGLAAGGYATLFALSSWRAWNTRKAFLLAGGLCAAGALAPLVLTSFAERFSKAPIEGSAYDERAAFQRAAENMLADHPMGVGANYYVVAANAFGYNSRAGVIPVAGSDSANVHNVYLLVAAETGWIGLAAFVLLLSQPLIAAFRCGWRSKRDPRGELLIGFGVALLTIYVHSYFEWILVGFSPQYMFALDAGLVAGLATQLGYWQRKARQPTYASPAGMAVTGRP